MQFSARRKSKYSPVLLQSLSYRGIWLQDATQCTIRHLWNLAAMVDMVPQDRVVTQCTALRIVRSTMKLLTAAARKNPLFSQQSGSILWHPKLREQCHIKVQFWSPYRFAETRFVPQKEVRFILMECSEPELPKGFVFRNLSSQHLAKLFRYHGISEKACARCTMSGAAFLRRELEFYKFHQGLSLREQHKVLTSLAWNRHRSGGDCSCSNSWKCIAAWWTSPKTLSAPE